MDFDVLIEIPAQGSVKYEVDEEKGKLRVDRFLHTAMYYPFNYGYIDGSKGDDGDPLDVIVISSLPVPPGILIRCHAIGLLEMTDEQGLDTKIVAVPVKKVDPVFGIYSSMKDCSKVTLDMIKHFFDHYKELEPGKWVKTGEYKDAPEANKAIEKSYDILPANKRGVSSKGG